MNQEELAKVLREINHDGKIDCNEYQGEDFFKLLDKINKDDIQIDKQKVNEAIDKFAKTYVGLPICLNLTDDLKKELKL